jgi:hypothetical protein
MKTEATIKVIVTKEENDILRKAVDILCDMARDSIVRHYFNENLPCGYGIEDVRDSLGYVFDLVVEE